MAARELFEGIRVRTLREGENGAKAQVVGDGGGRAC
jgi:hypothetical protein